MAWLTEPIIALIVFLGRHPSFPMAVAIVLPIVAAILLPTPSGKPFSKPARLVLLLSVLCIVANFWIGNWVANMAIYLGGVQGSAIVTSTRTLNESYNYRDVVGYDISIQTADGRSVKTMTRSDDFNIYPSGRQVFSAQSGQFKIKYLEHIPSVFILLAN